MPLLNSAAAIYLGSTAIDAVYLAGVQVWTKPEVVVGVLMAYHEDWPAWSAWDGSSGPTPVRITQGGMLAGGDLENSGSGGVGNYVDWQFDVAAGTYTLTIIRLGHNDVATFDLKIDGTTVGSFDGYVTPLTNNVVTTVAGIALTAGNHTLRALITGRNASASFAYMLRFGWISLDRTGA